MVLLLIVQPALYGASPDPTARYYLELVEGGFTNPVYATSPHGDKRLFVVEKDGKVKVLEDDLLIGTYIDVKSLLPVSPSSEQGLLGMAFHPDFSSNGKIYLSYTNRDGDLVISELTVDPTADAVNTSGLRKVIEIGQPASNHNGGMILFGLDDMLYLGSGDGGGSGDPGNNGQNKGTLLGAILRIDVNNDSLPIDANRNYGFPSDNPFVGIEGADEIWAYGLRNPWRFSFDPITERLYIGDVGQDQREEITVLDSSQRGANLGWNRLEGTRCYPSGGSCSSVGTVLPQLEYSHGLGSASVTGEFVYRGSEVSGIYGHYFYADFVAGWVRSFEFKGSASSRVSWEGSLPTDLVSSFGLDADGELLIVSFGGNVWRLRGPSDHDEMFFYRDDGLYRYYSIKPDGTLSSPLLAGDNYTTGWTSISAVNLDQ